MLIVKALCSSPFWEIDLGYPCDLFFYCSLVDGMKSWCGDWSSLAGMILSALLTSVGINLGLCFLFFTLYSILRKQPGNINVYAPRLVSEGKSQRTNRFNLDRLLPSASWVTRAWQPSEEDLLSTSGLDAVVFMRMFIFR